MERIGYDTCCPKCHAMTWWPDGFEGRVCKRCHEAEPGVGCETRLPDKRATETRRELEAERDQLESAIWHTERAMQEEYDSYAETMQKLEGDLLDLRNQVARLNGLLNAMTFLGR